jgi:hypothetical protein
MGLYIIIGKFQPRSLPNCPRLPYDRGKNIQGFENYQEIREKQESHPEFSNQNKTEQRYHYGISSVALLLLLPLPLLLQTSLAIVIILST